ncbi:MAG: Asparagine--tRNA ligase [Planctomycetes bacterium]|nr:Asparagine--tRNA ligase [Planctomycetota bacterium]
MSESPLVSIESLPRRIGATVRVGGWVTHHRAKGKLAFLVVRDGTGTVQCVVSKADVGDAAFDAASALTIESSLVAEGEVRADPRSPSGVELGVKSLRPVGASPDYPITPKEHGDAFLMEHRHLWLRSSRQHAVLRIRHEVERAVMDFLHDEGFIRFDTPILTPCAAEGTSNLFATEYFDLGKAYLAQTGQLYVEAGMMSLGRVYCFGPTFRAEKSKTRRHLCEFWMVEPEAAFVDHDGNLDLQQRMFSFVVERCLERRRAELTLLERDLAALERVKPPFPRITYDDALARIAAAATEEMPALSWGEDLGAPHEVFLSNQFDRPVFVERYPAAIKAFYMQPDPARPEVVLCADMLAPGFGEIIGGSQRIFDEALLRRRLEEHGLDAGNYRWYLDLRKYGSVPHSGFGMGIERAVLWITGLSHVREAIPFSRTLYRIYP